MCSSDTDELIAECEKYLRDTESSSQTPGSPFSSGLASTFPPPKARAKNCAVHESPHVHSDELLGAAADSLARMSLADAPALVEGLFTSTGRHRDGSRFRTHVVYSTLIYSIIAYVAYLIVAYSSLYMYAYTCTRIIPLCTSMLYIVRTHAVLTEIQYSVERVAWAGDEEYRVWISKVPPRSLQLVPFLEPVRDAPLCSLHEESSPRSPSPPLDGVDFDALARTPENERLRLDESSPLQVVDHTAADRFSSDQSPSSPILDRTAQSETEPERRYPIACLDSLELERRYEDRYLDLAPLGKGGFSYVRTALKRDDFKKVLLKNGSFNLSASYRCIIRALRSCTQIII